jgi:FAD dependent oxidoreductase
MNFEIQNVERSWDVIVVGGGTAGAIASIAAARAGAKTLVVEALGSLGGSGTNAQVTPLMRNISSGENLNRGITDDLKRRLIERCDGAVDNNNNDNWFNPEGMKFVLERMLVEAGGEILYHTHFVATQLEGQKISSIVIHNKDGLLRLKAHTFIDATGDADVTVSAGAPFDGGDADGIHQAMSLRFILGGVNLERLCTFLADHGQAQESSKFMHFWMVWEKKSSLEPLFRQAVIDGVLLERDGDYFQGFSIPGMPGCISFNCPRLDADLNDGASAWTLSKAQVDGKLAIDRLLHFCRKYLAGCEHSFIASYAQMVGVRETRRIRGEYVLTLEDILECKKFDDAICKNHYPVDIHTPRGKKLVHERTGAFPYFQPDAYHEIPYRSLIPLEIENLLVPGRCASATFEAQSAIRVQQNCHSMGEAAGLAAALCARDKLGVRAIKTLELRQALIAQGANL